MMTHHIIQHIFIALIFMALTERMSIIPLRIDPSRSHIRATLSVLELRVTTKHPVTTH